VWGGVVGGGVGVGGGGGGGGGGGRRRRQCSIHCMIQELITNYSNSHNIKSQVLCL